VFSAWITRLVWRKGTTSPPTAVPIYREGDIRKGPRTKEPFLRYRPQRVKTQLFDTNRGMIRDVQVIIEVETVVEDVRIAEGKQAQEEHNG
jgi:hypothetical protein